MHSDKANDVDGNWFRFDRYELRNGVIVPATIEQAPGYQRYDPWKKYRSNAGTYRTVEQPYVALLELVRELEDAEVRGVYSVHADLPDVTSTKILIGPQNEADDLITEWCNRHGLLGLVSSLCNSIVFAAEVRALVRHANTRVLKQEMHVRDGGRWNSVREVDTITETTSNRAEATARRAAKERSRPGVTWFNRYSSVYERAPLDSIRRFFPYSSQQATKFRPPCPNQDEFWASYGEPVSDFILWSRLFTHAVERLSRWPGTSKKGDPAGAGVDTERPFRILSGLAQTAAPSFRLARVVVDEPRQCASLLASYALMFLWDHMDGRRVIRCENCSRFFVSNERRASYCAVSCRNTAQSRRHRTKRRGKWAAGQDVAQGVSKTEPNPAGLWIATDIAE